MLKGRNLKELKNKLIKIFLEKVIKDSSFEDFSNFLNNFKHYADIYKSGYDDNKTLIELIQKIKKSKLSNKEETLLSVCSYIFLVEGLIYQVINFVCYLLVLDGHDLFSMNKRNYVEDVAKIVRVDMSTKIKFLNKHQFKKLTKYYDSTFRNDLVHHNYVLTDEGELLIRGKKIDINSKLESLFPISTFFDELMGDILTLARNAQK